MTPWRDILRALRPRRLSHWVVAGLIGVVLFLALAAYVLRGDITEAFLDPRVPYQTYRPPPAPDYSHAGDWALIPANPALWSSKDPPADVFFIHPTTYDGGRHWNADLYDRKAVRLLERTMIPNYAGPFARAGRVFAPRYRQANLYSHMTLREDAREARAFAYRDIAAAFEFYMAHYNQGRPFVIVGVEQGGPLADRLVRDLVEPDPERLKRMAVLYGLETGLDPARHGQDAATPACTTRQQAGCVVAYLSEAFNEQRGIRTFDRLRHTAIWKGDALTDLPSRQPLCVNPLNGGVTNEAQPRTLNIGAVNASRLEWGERPGFQANQVGAQCVKGVLKITQPSAPSLRGGQSWIERQRVRGYNLFYGDLEADALARVDIALGRPGVGRLAPPLTSVVEIRPRHVRPPN